MSTKMDISNYIKPAQRIEQEFGIPTSVTLGQMILESRGEYEGNISGLAYAYNNFFGVKDTSNKTAKMVTTEYVNGVPVTINASFKKYDSVYDSMRDYANTLMKDRYTDKTKGAINDVQYITGVWQGGYATDINYVDKVVGVIESYGLRKYNVGNSINDGSFLSEFGEGDINTSKPKYVSKYDEYGNPALDTKNVSNSLGINTDTWEVEGYESTENLSIIQRTIRTLLVSVSIILLLVLFVVFFLKAFPNVTPNVTKLKGLI